MSVLHGTSTDSPHISPGLPNAASNCQGGMRCSQRATPTPKPPTSPFLDEAGLGTVLLFSMVPAAMLGLLGFPVYAPIPSMIVLILHGVMMQGHGELPT